MTGEKQLNTLVGLTFPYLVVHWVVIIEKDELTLSTAVFSPLCTSKSQQLNVEYNVQYTVDCTMYSAQCSVQCTVYCLVHNTHYTVQCLVHSSQWTVLWLIHSRQCTVYSVQCTVHSAQCTVHSAQCTMNSAQCTAHSAQCTVHSAHCTVHSAQWKVHSAQSGVVFDPRTVSTWPLAEALEFLLFQTFWWKNWHKQCISVAHSDIFTDQSVFRKIVDFTNNPLAEADGQWLSGISGMAPTPIYWPWLDKNGGEGSGAQSNGAQRVHNAFHAPKFWRGLDFLSIKIFNGEKIVSLKVYTRINPNLEFESGSYDVLTR